MTHMTQAGSEAVTLINHVDDAIMHLEAMRSQLVLDIGGIDRSVDTDGVLDTMLASLRGIKLGIEFMRNAYTLTEP